PPQGYRGDPTEEQRAASRADLVRYAAATRDWNPIHWDHDAAVAAGIPGVVTHGLLQAAWALETASRHGTGMAPVSSARLRFRSPLLPGRPVDLSVEPVDGAVSVSVADLHNEYLNARVELANG